MKKLCTILAALALIALCLTLIPTEVEAASESDLTFKLNSDGQSYYVAGCEESASGSLTIPATYNGKPVTSIGNGAFYYRYSLTNVTIPDSVTSIGDSAFNGCESLTSVTLGDSVTSIGGSAFYGCSKLTSITIPNSVTSIGDNAFTDCTSLTCNVYANANYLGNSTNPYLVLVKATSTAITSCSIHNATRFICDNAFLYCSELTSITISNSVTSIGNYAFLRCTSLTSIIIPDSVTSIGSNTFNFCSSLSNVSMPDSVTKIYSTLFIGCSRLSYNTYDNALYLGNNINPYTVLMDTTSTAISECKIHPNTKIIAHGAFEFCDSLTSVTIGDSVTSIGGSAFSDCSKLTSITIPDSVTSIGDGVFLNCTNLTSVTIPDSVTSIGAFVFEYCDSLTDVIYCGTEQQWNQITIGSYNDDLLNAQRSYHNYVGGSCVIPSTCTYCGAEGEKTAHNVVDGICTKCQRYGTCGDNLTWTLDDEGTLTISGTGAMTNYSDSSHLPWRYSIKNLVIEDGVTSIGNYAFHNCTSLTSIGIPDSVTNIGTSAFEYCYSLKSITISSGITSIGTYAFKDCIGLEEINFNATNMQDFNESSNVFYCAGHNGAGIVLNIGANVTKIPTYLFRSYIDRGPDYADPDDYWYTPNITTVTFAEGSVCKSIGSYAFHECSTLTDISLPDSVTSIGDFAFSRCSKMTGINIHNGVTSIGNGAFSSCSSITSITLPDSVTSIGDNAFSGCSRLTSITIPNSVTNVGNGAFSSCSGITSIALPDSLTSIGNYTFSYCYGLTSITIPNSVTSIGYNAFGGCVSLTSVDIPDGVTSIGYLAFYNCTGLTSITISDSVTSIGGNAFYNCTSLTDVTYCGTEELWNQITIYSNNDYLTTANRSYHNMVNGQCSLCGYSDTPAWDGDDVTGTGKPTSPVLDEMLTIPGKSMLLGGYIGAQFTVNPEAAGKYDSVYIVVVFDGQEYTYDTSLVSDQMIFEHRVAPKYMGEALQITAYGVKNGVIYYGETEFWSIRDGIMERLEKFYPYIKYEQYMNRCVLLVDMLYYGAAAQTRFGTDENGLLTYGLDAKYAALRTITEPTIAKTNTGCKTTTNQLYKYNLGIEDAVQMQFTFRLKVEDYSQYLVKITANGTTYEYTGESFIPQGDTSTLKKFVTVVFDKLEAVNMRDEITVELWQNGAKVSDTYTASIEGIATAGIAADNNVNLLKAMITYGDSAKISLS